MATINEAFYGLKAALESLYDERESSAIAHELMANLTGMSKMQRLEAKDKKLDAGQNKKLTTYTERALTGEPVQHITNEQWFFNRPFYVNKHVLIPRPETEELVQWVIDDNKQKPNLSILEIGTGSGCIAVSIKRKLPQATITAIDISKEALAVAKKNATAHEMTIQFKQVDFLDKKTWASLGVHDIIISNPPYIPIAEKEKLEKNVREYEPSLALFTPNEDPLLFYKHIAMFAATNLNKEGAVYCETHKDFAQASLGIFEEMNFRHLQLKKDMAGNDRMIKAS